MAVSVTSNSPRRVLVVLGGSSPLEWFFMWIEVHVLHPTNIHEGIRFRVLWSARHPLSIRRSSIWIFSFALSHRQENTGSKHWNHLFHLMMKKITGVSKESKFTTSWLGQRVHKESSVSTVRHATFCHGFCFWLSSHLCMVSPGAVIFAFQEHPMGLSTS